MAGNKNLNAAAAAKKDEFYTQLSDIANELKHYTAHFDGKTVLCNCDDPYESNFFKYFALMFNTLKLKKLICTCWDGSPIAGKELDLFSDTEDETGRSRVAYKIELTEMSDLNGDGAVDLGDVELFLKNNKPELLKEHGDFRSAECIELLKEADIVVTNPPFSLFREYVAQLVEYEKKFIIIGNKLAISYKEVFPLIKDNKMWVGMTPMTKDLHFVIPQYYIDDAQQSERDSATIVEDGKILGRSPAVWFTNLDHKKRHYPLDLYKYYSSEEYPKYQNLDAIHIEQTAEIPIDYDGMMGVPISFLDKYCPEQFEILGAENSAELMPIPVQLGEEFVKIYRSQGGTGHVSPNMYSAWYFDKNGKAKRPFSRIYIRKKQ